MKTNNKKIPEFISIDGEPLTVTPIKMPELVGKDSVPVSPMKSPYNKNDIIELIKKFAETCDEIKVINDNESK